VGHVGRLVPEKNLGFLVEAVTLFLSRNPSARFLVAGSGPTLREIRERFDRYGMSERLHYAGTLRGDRLVDAYHAMDVFAFASQNETQGMVLTEAMAAGVPVVAVDAPGVRESVEDGRNGFLLPEMSFPDFAAALSRVAGLSAPGRREMGEAARETARRSSMERCARDTLLLYADARQERERNRKVRGGPWVRRIGREGMLWRNRAHAAAAALRAS